MPKRLILMCGLAFAGKSTLADAIAHRIDAQIISLDQINAERHLHGGEGIPDHEWIATHQIATQRLESLARKGSDIIVDDTNCFRWLRDNYRKTVQPFGYESLVVLLNVSPQLAMSRASRNNGLPTRGDVRPEIMQDLIDKFEYPVAGEEMILTYSPSQTIAEWLARNFPAH